MRKVIHIDMDCFYAAIEARDNPKLKNQPIAVGGTSKRSVLCTCNYIARKFGIHAAMPTAQALQLCPNLVIIEPRMSAYKEVSRAINQIFHEFTDLVEPLSLDEAFLEIIKGEQYEATCRGGSRTARAKNNPVNDNISKFKNSGTLIAKEIQKRIYESQGLTASAGVAPNKFLAKIASDWNKPNGLFVITPDDIDAFMLQLPITKIFGVGKVTAQKMHDLSIQTCGDLQQLSLLDLKQHFGTWGIKLYDLCRGKDDRKVEPNRNRKSLSTEITFINDLNNIEDIINEAAKLFIELKHRLKKTNTPIKKQFIKLKFTDFKTTTVETIVAELTLDTFEELCFEGFKRHNKPIRLLGLGVRFDEVDTLLDIPRQIELFS